jgi:hypothetical protein
MLNRLLEKYPSSPLTKVAQKELASPAKPEEKKK